MGLELGQVRLDAVTDAGLKEVRAGDLSVELRDKLNWTHYALETGTYATEENKKFRMRPYRRGQVILFDSLREGKREKTIVVFSLADAEGRPSPVKVEVPLHKIATSITSPRVFLSHFMWTRDRRVLKEVAEQARKDNYGDDFGAWA